MLKLPLQQEIEETLLPPPQVFVIGLPITINVVGIQDRDDCITAEDQMKQKPWETVQPDPEAFLKEYCDRKVKERPLHPKKEKEQPADDKIEPILHKNVVQSTIEYILR